MKETSYSWRYQSSRYTRGDIVMIVVVHDSVHCEGLGPCFSRSIMYSALVFGILANVARKELPSMLRTIGYTLGALQLGLGLGLGLGLVTMSRLWDPCTRDLG